MFSVENQINMAMPYYFINYAILCIPFRIRRIWQCHIISKGRHIMYSVGNQTNITMTYYGSSAVCRSDIMKIIGVLGGFVLVSPVNVKGRTKGKQFLFLSNMHFESTDSSAVV